MSTPLPVYEVTPLRTARVKFTPLRMENIHTHFRWNNDPELNRLDSEIPYEEEKFGKFKGRFEKMCEDPSPSRRTFEIHVLDDGEETLIGVAYVTHISPHNLHGQVGITIGERNYWGRGYGRESFELLLSYCFEALELHRVSAETFEYHTAWKDLVEGMGFQKEGTVREYLRRDGRYWDKEIYALLEQEYEVPRPKADEAPSVEQVA
ncbi:MAG: GNAT family N-acetyltransferase [Salinibacter sp.]